MSFPIGEQFFIDSVRAGLKAIYLSGWQVAAEPTLAPPPATLPELLAPASQDLIISYNTLSYTHPDAFPETWQALLGALRPGGVISASFLGDRDHWNRKYSGMTFVTREDVASMTDGLEELSVHERAEEITETSGDKRFSHIVTVVCRKPLPASEESTI